MLSFTDEHAHGFKHAKLCTAVLCRNVCSLAFACNSATKLVASTSTFSPSQGNLTGIRALSDSLYSAQNLSLVQDLTRPQPLGVAYNHCTYLAWMYSVFLIYSQIVHRLNGASGLDSDDIRYLCWIFFMSLLVEALACERCSRFPPFHLIFFLCYQ